MLPTNIKHRLFKLSDSLQVSKIEGSKACDVGDEKKSSIEHLQWFLSKLEYIAAAYYLQITHNETFIISYTMYF